jgi:hypothetical protein
MSHKALAVKKGGKRNGRDLSFPQVRLKTIFIKGGICMKKPGNKSVLLLSAVMLAVFMVFPVIALAELPVVKLIATGGTIAMKIDPVKKAPVPAISGEDLVATVPEISGIARIEVLNISNVPSGYMDPDRWVALQKAVSKEMALTHSRRQPIFSI